MEISTHHIDPSEAVSCVGVCFIQTHDMSKVGELGVLLLKAYLRIESALAENIELSLSRNEHRNVIRAQPGLSSQQRLDRTARGHQSSARDVGGGREHSRENLTDDTDKFIQYFT